MHDSLVTVNPLFVTPYAQDALDGEVGLTHKDIAVSLSVRPIDFKNRFFELGHDKLLGDVGLNFEMFSLKSGVRGRPEEVLVFSTEVARVLVANYPNNIGMGYAAWLVKMAHQVLAETQEDNARLRNENQTLAASIKKPRASLPSSKKALTVVLVKGLFGLEYAPARVARSAMTPKQTLAAKGLHILDVIKGAVEAFSSVQEDMAQEEMKTHEQNDLNITELEMRDLVKEILTKVHALKKSRADAAQPSEEIIH